MHLCLEKEGKSRNLIVYLLEGHAPRIAGLSGPSTENVMHGLEPGIWFKVMVVDKIEINCNTHAVWWKIEGDEAPGKDSSSNQHLFGRRDQYVYDFDDDVDELFRLAEYAIEANPLAETDEETRRQNVVEYEQTLFRMLHCYVLSKIELHPEHLGKIMAAYQTQVSTIQQLEKETLVHSRLAEHYYSKKREVLQKDILPTFEEYIRNREADKHFISVVKEDVERDLPAIQRQLSTKSDEVDILKKRCKTEDNYSLLFKELSEMRHQRDAVSELLKSYVQIKGCILFMERAEIQSIPATAAFTPAQKLYLDFNGKIRDEKRKVNELVMKKVLAASVRESLSVAKAALSDGQVTLGEEVTTDGQRTTNVNMDIGSNPEWQTLSERLATIVHNSEHPIGREFLDFTRETVAKCESISRNVRSFSTSTVGRPDTYLDYYVIGEEDVIVDKVLLESLRTEILLHLFKMSDLLTEFFKNYTTIFLNKVRLSYEKCFFQRVGDSLVDLYRLVYSLTVKSLENRIKCVREYPMCQLGLQMKDEWWLCLLDNGPSNDEAGNFSDDGSTGSTVSDPVEITGPVLSDSSETVELLRKNLQMSKSKVLSKSTGDLSLRAPHNHRGETAAMTRAFEHGNPKDSHAAIDGEVCNSYSILYNTDGLVRLSFETVPELRREQIRSASVTGMESHSWKGRSLRKLSCRRSSRKDSFQRHFGPTLASIRKVFESYSPLTKMQCLSTALKLLVDKVMELRMREVKSSDVDRSKFAVSADDLLPLLVLVLLKLEPADVGSLFVELIYISDLMADFLASGCHSYALTEFQIAYRVLDQTCKELEI